MQLRIEEKGNVVLCIMSGDIDINSAPEIKKLFEKDILVTKRDKVILSFRDVGYVDSSGLATMVDLFKKIKEYGGRMKMSQMSDKVKNLFVITKLDRLFEIFDSEEDALKSFGE